MKIDIYLFVRQIWYHFWYDDEETDIPSTHTHNPMIHYERSKWKAWWILYPLPVLVDSNDANFDAQHLFEPNNLKLHSTHV